MNRREGGTREVAMPASTLAALRRALQAEAGTLATIHGLHQAGYGAGASLYDAFTRGQRDHAPGDMPEEAFWDRLSRFLDQRGWGSLRHTKPHPGVGLLASRDWAEAEGGTEARSSCAFSTGLLSHLLSRAAGGPVAVLEATCRARGDHACTFAFGSRATIHDLYGLLLEGKAMEQALAEL